MPHLVRKYWKRWLLAAAMVLLCPVVIVGLLWRDSRPKQPPDVTLTFRGLAKADTNAAMFTISNRSAFPVVWNLFPHTNDPVTGQWKLSVPMTLGAIRALPSGVLPALSHTNISLTHTSSVPWRIEIGFEDIRKQPAEQLRHRAADFCRDRWLKNIDRSWWLELSQIIPPNKARGFTNSLVTHRSSPRQP